MSEKEGTERKLIFRETNKIFYTDPSCLPKRVKLKVPSTEETIKTI